MADPRGLGAQAGAIQSDYHLAPAGPPQGTRPSPQARAGASSGGSALGAQAASAFPLTHARLQPRVMPYAHPILDIQGSSTTRDFMALQSMSSMLALIVAVNVGVLVYARTATRQREIAVRTALGASRRRIVGQLFIEALVLSAVAEQLHCTLEAGRLARRRQRRPLLRLPRGHHGDPCTGQPLAVVHAGGRHAVAPLAKPVERLDRIDVW